MLRCAECGTLIEADPSTNGEIIECFECGIELELVDERLLALQLGPSEE